MTNEVGGIRPEISKMLYECGSTDYAEVRKYVKVELSAMLSKGQITKEDMKEALAFTDKDLAKALAARNRVDNYAGGLTKQNLKLLNETGLSTQDLYEVSKFAGEDFTINTVKLSKEEKAEAEKGKITRSELVNIQNELNARIKANGNDKVLTEKEVLKLMKGIGLADGTKKVSTAKGILAGIFPPFNIANAIVAGVTNGNEALVFKTREEKAFGAQSDSKDGSVMNKTETKMAELKKQYEEEMFKDEPDELVPSEEVPQEMQEMIETEE